MKVQDIIKKKIEIAERRILELIKAGDLKNLPDAEKYQISRFYEEKSRSQPLSAKSAGCVFKNPPGQSAGGLIDQSGLKGFKVGGAMVSRKHANFIVNWSSATAAQVLELIQRIREEVEKRFGVWLEPEIKIW